MKKLTIKFLAVSVVCLIAARENCTAQSLKTNTTGVEFVNVAAQAGITTQTVFGGELKNKYLLETTGSGAAFLDYDNDGWQDIFLVGGTRLDLAASPKQTPSNRLYRNNRNGTFSDATIKAGITQTGWGQGVCVGDIDADGDPDIFVSRFGKNLLYRNNRDGTFTDIAVEAGNAFSIDGKPQAGMGVTAGDYDRDGWLDIFKTNFSGDTSSLYRNLGVPNNDKGDAKTANDVTFDDVTFPAGIGINTRWLGWGCGFFDFDNNGWLDILLVNGHVYPEVVKLTTEAGYAQRKVLYRSLRNGRFEDVTEQVGGALMQATAARGCAFGDYDNDGDTDVIINPVNATPELLRLDSATTNNWITIKTVGTKSNRDGLGARIKCITDDGTQTEEVRSGGSFYSNNDMRVHFGLGKSAKIKTLEVKWLGTGTTDTLRDVAANQFITIKEGVGLIATQKR